MKSLQMPPTIEPSAVRVLSVSPVEEDHIEIERILDKSARVTPTGTCWQLSLSRTLASALTAVRQAEFAVIVCESSLGPGSWKDLMEDTQDMMNSSVFIVTSLRADDRLWAEALNLGAYDVVAKPFHPAELTRVVNLACMRWQQRAQYSDRRPFVRVAAC